MIVDGPDPMVTSPFLAGYHLMRLAMPASALHRCDQSLISSRRIVSGGPEEGGVGVVEADGLAVGSERVHA